MIDSQAEYDQGEILGFCQKHEGISVDVTWEERQGPELGESLSDAEASTEERTSP